MPDILIAADADYVVDEILASISGPGTDLRVARRGIDVLPAARDRLPDLVICDLQIGNMGGMAVTIDFRHEEGADRLDRVPVLMLLDREADVYLARRSLADGWLVKPLDPFRLRRAADAVLAGEGTFDGVDPDEWPALRAAARGETYVAPEPADDEDTEDDAEAESVEAG
ncbi:MAG: response regulator [Actinomycetota bacterium]